MIVEQSNLNRALAKRYELYLDTIQNNTALKSSEYSYPLLMNVFADYDQVPIKILFVGKETYGWIDTMDNQENLKVDSIMREYEGFQFAKEIRNHYSPFWRFIRTFHQSLNGVEYPLGFLWTNVAKHDVNKTTPTKKQRLVLTEGFRLLVDEIAIVKPDVVLFMAGWTYDKEIAEVFPDIAYTTLEENSIYQCHHPNLPFHTYAFRHPNYLQRANMFSSTIECIYSNITRSVN